MCGGGGGIIETITNPIGDVIDTVTDVGKEAGNFVGDVIEKAADNPIETALVIAAVATANPELLGLSEGSAAATAVDAGDAIYTTYADLPLTASQAAAAGAGTGADIAAEATLGTGLDAASLTNYVEVPPTASEVAAANVATGAGTATDAASLTDYIPTAPTPEQVAAANNSVIDYNSAINQMEAQGGAASTGILSPQPTYFDKITDFASNLIPKTPADIARTLGYTALSGGLGVASQNKPVGLINTTLPAPNIPQYGTKKNIFDAYYSAKNNVNNILYPQGLLTNQPRDAGIFTQYLLQKGLL
jgi:hypothetical protein